MGRVSEQAVNIHPFLRRVAIAMSEERLEGIMIGNAGAALHGAPVTTQDVDFFLRDTPRNREKIRALADDLEGRAWQPYYPTSRMIQIQSDSLPMPVEFVFKASGIRSFEGLRGRAVRITFDGGQWSVLVASLEDIIKSKRAAGRPKDIAALPVIEATLRQKQHAPK